MDFGALGYLLFGVALVVVFAAIWIYTFAKKRQAEVEEAKYRMLEGDDD